MTWGMIFYEAVIFAFIYKHQEILPMINNETKKTLFFTLRREGVVCLFLVIAILAVYWQVGDHEFVNYDDKDYITENQHVRAGLTSENIAWAAERKDVLSTLIFLRKPLRRAMIIGSI